MSENETNDQKIIKLWMSQLDERLGWLDSVIDDLGFNELVAWSDELSERVKQLTTYVKEMQTRAGQILEHGEVMAVTGLDGQVMMAERSSRANTRNLQRDDLMAAVDRLANSQEFRVDKSTGEVEAVADARLRAYRLMFRMEPRWGELRKHGIEQDEYAEVDRVPTITLKKASN